MTEDTKLIPKGSVPLNVLIVEDNVADAKIALRAFKNAKIKNNVIVVNDGLECLKYLKREEPYQDKTQYPWPNLILLDISMPKVDGFAVLKELKKDLVFDIVPVIVLSGSKHREDVRKSYENGANSFIQKPVSYEAFVDLVEGFNYYWNVLNRLPEGENWQ